MRYLLQLLVAVSAVVLMGAGGSLLLSEGPGLLLISLGLALGALCLWPTARKRAKDSVPIGAFVVVLGALAVIGLVLVVLPRDGSTRIVVGTALLIGALSAAVLLTKVDEAA